MILRELVQFREIYTTKAKQAELLESIEAERAELKEWHAKAATQINILSQNVYLFRKYAEENLFPNNDETLKAVRDELEARGLLTGVERPTMVFKKINEKLHIWIGRGVPDSDEGKWVRQHVRELPKTTSSQ